MQPERVQRWWKVLGSVVVGSGRLLCWSSLIPLLRVPVVNRRLAPKLDRAVRGNEEFGWVVHRSLMSFYLRHREQDCSDSLLRFLLDSTIADMIEGVEQFPERFSYAGVAAALAKLYLLYRQYDARLPAQALDVLKDVAARAGCYDDLPREVETLDPWELARAAYLIYYKTLPSGWG